MQLLNRGYGNQNIAHIPPLFFFHIESRVNESFLLNQNEL